MEIDLDIPQFLATQKRQAPASLQNYYNTFEDLYERKYVLSQTYRHGWRGRCIMWPMTFLHILTVWSLCSLALLTTTSRLWHQLTLSVQEFVSKPESGPFQVALYQHFISDWESKMSQLKLVLVGVSAARQIPGIQYVLFFLGQRTILTQWSVLCFESLLCWQKI